MKKYILKLSLLGIASTALQTQLCGLDNTTLTGITDIQGPVKIDDGNAPEAWTTAPVSPYWNLQLDDGLFIYGDGDSTSDLLNLDFDGTEGALMFWYPEKKAFRAGQPSPDSWDEANIGEGSFGFGDTTQASGLYSTAWGVWSKATGDFSTAWGQAEAVGLGATAWGF